MLRLLAGLIARYARSKIGHWLWVDQWFLAYRLSPRSPAPAETFFRCKTIDPPRDIRIADDAESFADQCLELLANDDTRRAVAAAALDLVRTRFSWEVVTDRFVEAIR